MRVSEGEWCERVRDVCELGQAYTCRKTKRKMEVPEKILLESWLEKVGLVLEPLATGCVGVDLAWPPLDGRSRASVPYLPVSYWYLCFF